MLDFEQDTFEPLFKQFKHACVGEKEYDCISLRFILLWMEVFLVMIKLQKVKLMPFY